MDFVEFRNVITQIWDEYFDHIGNHFSKISSTGTALFPTHILFLKMGNFWGMELIGTTQFPKKLIQKVAHYESANDYFDFFGEKVGKPALKLGRLNNHFRDLLFSRGGDVEIAKQRFPFLSFYESALKFSGGSGPLIGFPDIFENACFERCSVVNTLEGLYRGKNILFLAIFSKDVSASAVESFFDQVLEKKSTSRSKYIKGIFTATDKTWSAFQASQLQNLYLSKGVKETTIGSFLNTHPEILKAVFKTDTFVYEPTLRWIEHNGTVEETSIKPDLLIQRSDGNYDILDLKLALLDKKTITAGGSNRRRFTTKVLDGISQLANYEFYFSFAQNIEYAKEKYGIIIEDPRLILVIGNMENCDLAKVTQALRSHPQISIINYDALVTSYMTYAPSEQTTNPTSL